MTSSASNPRPGLRDWRDAAALTGVAALVRLFGVRRAIALLRPVMRPRATPIDPAQHLATAGKLARRIGRIADALPVPPRCLVRSIVLATALRRHGVPADIEVGVKMDEGFAAHAWVEVYGVVVNDSPASVAQYRRLWSAPHALR
jgi:hypothetical protein